MNIKIEIRTLREFLEFFMGIGLNKPLVITVGEESEKRLKSALNHIEAVHTPERDYEQWRKIEEW